MADEIEVPLMAEAARWGSYRAAQHPYKTGPFEAFSVAHHWRMEVDRSRTNYFAARRDVVLEQLRERGLYAEAAAGK